MNYFWNKHNSFYRISASVLIILHLVTFGPIREALAFMASSTNYKLTSDVNAGGKERSGSTTNLWQDVIGEPAIGNSQSISYILNAGLIPTIQSNSPTLTKKIPPQNWPMNSSKENAFDLDDYFISPEGYPLTFTVSDNSNIKVTIDSATHIVSFSQAEDWYGVEKVYFYATDTEHATVQSNKVVLQVENTAGPDKPVIVDVEITPSIIKEGDLVKLVVKAQDLDNDDINFSYSDFFTETKRYKDGDFWFSEATWQTNFSNTGHYNIKVTATDPSGLTDQESVVINIGNFNHPPVLESIADITAIETDTVTITPKASDPDGDAITFYYSYPFDTQGKWLTDYDDAGTYNVIVIASDGIDTVSQPVKITINNKNQAPNATLTLSKYTVMPNEEFSIIISGSDPDGDSITFSLKKDGTEVASGSITTTYTTTTSFANIGDHTIEVTIIDSGGLSSTDTKGADVVDPNANRDSINPVMGDFNGDCLTDLGVHNSDTGTWEIAISDEGVFRNAVDWLPSGFGTSRDQWPIGGDFDGDGKTDVGIYNNSNGELKIALSLGSNFKVSGTWLTASFASYSWQPFTGNFNGDKYTDFALYNKDTGEVRVALGTGTGFGAFNTWINNFGNDYVAMGGDFNGDSLTDLLLFKKSSGEFKVAFSNTKEFVDGSSWISGFATDKDVLVSDFNNDGLADIGYWDKSSFKWYYAISTGATFVDKGAWIESFGTSQDESVSTGDFNGDGITDAATFDRDEKGIDRWKVRLSTNKPADLLVEIDNGIGGKTQVAYTYAAKSDNDLLPFPVYVASSISLINAFPAERPATYTQNFNFSGGYYDAQEREFRGFAKVTVTDPITNNYTETYFYQGKPGQDGALKGQIEKLIAYDGNNCKISRTLNTYEVKKGGPSEDFLGYPALVEQNTTIWEENGTSITTRDKITYDNIGNVTEQLNEGDTSKTGDEKSAATTYAQAYDIGFNRPLESILKDKGGAIVTQKNFEYDSKGNLIKDIAVISNPITLERNNAIAQYAYDSFGNLTSATNARGYAVTTDYETDFYTYPEKISNSLGHTIQYVYEPKFGVVKSVTDANGQTTTTSYDSFGRVTQVKNVFNQITATYTYPDFNTKTTTNAVRLFKTEYIDGLGRKYKTISSGEDSTSPRNIVTEVFYNERGLVSSESLAHYVDDDSTRISYIRYEYDIRGRIKKTVSDFYPTRYPANYPFDLNDVVDLDPSDAASSIDYKNPLYTETTDPMGHKKGTKKDVYGNIMEVIEVGVYHTYYEYDTQNNLIKTTDNQGNITQIFYDSLGRKLKMLDPDMGTWTYEYDLVGNLTKQTDAKGQLLEFTYNALNRLIEKKGLSLTLATYVYDDPDKDYCIGRLSKITDLSGSTEFFYDKLGREIKSVKGLSPEGTVPEQYVVVREYDILDRLTKLTYPDGEEVEYSYDENSGLLEKVKGLSPKGTDPYVKDITYNAQGQIKTIQYGNGTSTNYTYGQDLRLSRIYTQGLSPTGTVPVQDLNYLFDHNGNLTTLTETDNLRSNIRTYQYDDLDRLTLAQNVPSPEGGFTDYSYQYDSIGNMTYKSDIGVMSYGLNAGPHALTGAGGYTYQYDKNGNMTVGKNKTLEYDMENRLLKVDELGRITTFIYDGDGGRVKKATATSSTTYIGSLFEKDSDGKTRKHIFAGSNRIATISLSPGGEGGGEGVISYYHSDHLGSSSIITDSTGSQVQHLEYTPYGTIAQNEGTDLVKHKFTGKELDETGLYFYGARYYDPELGRFISADTIVPNPFAPQTLNRYTYCYNNPLKYVDPTGHWGWIIWAIIGAIVGGTAGGVAAAQNGGEVWQGVLFGALMGGLSGGTLGSSSAALILKFAAGISLFSQVTAAMPGNTWSSISRYSGYTAAGLAGAYTAWNIGVGIKDWAVGKGSYHNVATGTKLSAEEVVAEYGEKGAAVFTNGITQDLQEALDAAKKAGADVLFYNPTHGAIADLTESALGWVTHTESLSRQLGRLATQMRVDLIGYSQGSIISANASIYAGLTGGAVEGSTISTIGSAVGRIRLVYSGAIGGVNASPSTMHSFDFIKLFSSEVNPIGYLEGVIGLFPGNKSHVNY